MMNLINKMKGMKVSYWVLSIMMLVFVSCKGGGAGGAFSNLDPADIPVTITPPTLIHINSAIPSGNAIAIASSTQTTFGVTLDSTDASVKYEYKLDSTTVLQDGSSAFYYLDPGLIGPGSHTITVKAYNSISSDSHTFNLTINYPSIVNTFTPNLVGTSLACGIDTVTLSALYSDANPSDITNVKWYYNDTLISLGNTQANTMNDPGNNLATMNFHPNCTHTGVNFLRLDLNDGKEITSQTWTIFVTSPIVIHIADAIPLTNPTVFTNATSTTFAVTLTNPDSTANYNFVLDNTISLQNDHRTYVNINGATLTAGTHTLKVTASNSSSSDFKIFNIRKNSPPSVTAFNPPFSGNTVACGTTPITLYADYVDPNGDSLNVTWSVDDAPSAYIVPANSGNRAQASFVPNCSIAGVRVVKASVSDGYETTTTSWSVNVVSPSSIVITSFLPTANPVIITNSESKTFAVALSSSDPNVTYNFILKNLNTNVTSTIYAGSAPFFDLVGSSISAGLYQLDVIASNGSSSDHHVFTVRKNSPPALPPSPLTFSPALTGVVLSCGSSSQLFRSAVADSDNDIMAINWFLDGAAAPANLVSTSTQTEVSATYSPTCAEVGIKSIRVEVFDGHEKTTKTWTVSIINPTIVTINAYSPNTDPVHVLSAGAQTFTVSASGKAPLAYEWKLDNAVISAATGAFTTISAASLTTGAHTLIVKVTDSDSTQSKTFNIIKNAIPVLANKAPVNQNIKININTVTPFSATFTDANSDPMTITWKLNNVVVSAGNSHASISSGMAISTLTLSPSAAIIGDNTVELIINDGYEPTSYIWHVNINYFSDVCNNMGAGRACTIIGRPGMGSGINPQTNPEGTRIQPMFLTSDENGNYFFSDPNTHTVWFYNKTASAVNILGQSIGAGKLQIVAGIGMSGTGISGISYNDFPLNTPRGLAWDNVNKRLFIANESTNQILMVDPDGIVTIVAGGGGNNTAGNANGTLATASYCGTPRGMYYHSGQQKLYVACQAAGTIKAIDTSSTIVSAWTANIVTGRASSGATGNATVDGTNGVAGTAQISSPNHLKYDTLNDVLYVTTSGDCRVRAINMTSTARTNYYFGSVTLPASSTATVIGNNCTTYTAGTFSAARFNGGWMGIELYMSGSTLLGFFISDYNTHRVAFANNHATNSYTFGNTAVGSYSMGTIWGNGTAGYYMPCSSASSTTCYTYNPSTLLVQGTKLLLADYQNFRIRMLNLALPDGAVVDDIGFDSKRGFAGNGGSSSEYVQFNQPMNLYYNDNTDKLLISDFYNYRIRSLNMITGRIDSFIGNGAGDANTSNADPSVLGTRGPRGVVNYQNKVIYADNQNNNCVLRALNTDSTNQSVLGVLINANAVQTIAGNWGQGCGAWNTLATTGTNANARLNNPQGVTTDGTNLYFANTGAHCIIKVDSSGNMSTFSGLCGTSGASNGAGTAYNNAIIRYSFPTAVVADPRAPYNTSGNLFILDQTTTGPTKVRYLNQGTTAVTVYGININPGEIRTIYTAADGHGADLAAFDSMVCFSSGGDFNYSSNATSSTANNNVICFNRDESTGTSFYRFGRNPSSFIGRGAQPYNLEEEGAAATGISLAGPAGLAFDENGNLFVAERDAHSIRMIKKWW